MHNPDAVGDVEFRREYAVSAYLHGDRMRDVAEALNVSTVSVYNYLRHEGIHALKDRIDRAKALHEKGVPLDAIAQQVGRTPAVLRLRLMDAGLVSPGKLNRPAIDRRDAALAMHARGVSEAAIAERLGLLPHVVRRYLRMGQGVPTHIRQRQARALYDRGVPLRDIEGRLGLTRGAVRTMLRLSHKPARSAYAVGSTMAASLDTGE